MDTNKNAILNIFCKLVKVANIFTQRHFFLLLPLETKDTQSCFINP